MNDIERSRKMNSGLERAQVEERRLARLLYLASRPKISEEEFLKLLEKYDWGHTGPESKRVAQEKVILRHVDSCDVLKKLYYNYKE